MSLVPITLACWTYDRVARPRTGRILIDGVDLNMVQRG
jgi:hypothetical protein